MQRGRGGRGMPAFPRGELRRGGRVLLMNERGRGMPVLPRGRAESRGRGVQRQPRDGVPRASQARSAINEYRREKEELPPQLFDDETPTEQQTTEAKPDASEQQRSRSGRGNRAFRGRGFQYRGGRGQNEMQRGRGGRGMPALPRGELRRGGRVLLMNERGREMPVLPRGRAESRGRGVQRQPRDGVPRQSQSRPRHSLQEVSGNNPDTPVLPQPNRLIRNRTRRNEGRQGFKGAKPTSIAMMRTQITGSQTLYLKRLTKDFQELKNSEIPLVGVAAVPDEKFMHIWHVNIRGPEGTPYQGGVFHMILKFTKFYPSQPPELFLCTPLQHPCVDQLTKKIQINQLSDLQKNSAWYEGWQSAYTVETILIQLQAFLFERTKEAMFPFELENARQAVETANAFKCIACRHRGSIECYPSFDPKETTADQFVTVTSDRELLQREFLCYYTKKTLAETTLGIGVSIKRAHKTGEINSVFPTLDLLSNKAFTKHSIRKSMANEPFNYWLPLFFGESEPYEDKKLVYDEATKTNKYEVKQIDPLYRFQHLLRKKLCFMTRGTTKTEFKPLMALAVFPKLIVTHLVQLADDTKHHSIIAIRRLFNFIRAFSMLLELHPEIEAEMDKRIQSFLASPEQRVKDKTPSLGDILVFTLMSRQYKLSDVLNAYVEEQLDRQVMWIINKIPELDHTNYSHKDKNIIMEESRSEVCFKVSLTGNHLTLIFYELASLFETRYQNKLTNFNFEVDANFGCIPMPLENDFQAKIRQIKRIENYRSYFGYLGISCPDDEALTLRLRNAVTNSYKKKYHGYHSNGLSWIGTQHHELVKSEPNAFHLYDKEAKTFADSSDPRWQKACLDRFSKVRRYHLHYFRKLTVPEIALKIDTQELIALHSGSHEDPIKEIKDIEMYGKWSPDQIKQTTAYQEYPPDFNWRDLFHKLVFEEILEHFNRVPKPLKELHEYVKLLAPQIQVLRIPVMQQRLKSRNYWLLVVLGRLTNLRVLKFHAQESNLRHMVALTANFYKFMKKGMAYNALNGGKIQKVSFTDLCLPGVQGLESELHGALAVQSGLVCLQFAHCQFKLADATAVKRIMESARVLKEISFDGCKFDDGSKAVGEVADGVIQAKKLEVFKMVDCKAGEEKTNVNQVIYNLSFGSFLKFVYLKNTLVDEETFEFLDKFFFISGSIETFILNHQEREYFKKKILTMFSIGQNKSLKYVNIYSPETKDTSVNIMIGAILGIQHSACKSNDLRALSLQHGIFPGYFPEDFRTNEEMIFAARAHCIGEDYKPSEEPKEKEAYFNLDFVDISACNFDSSDSEDENKPKRQRIPLNVKELRKQSNPIWPCSWEYATIRPFTLIARELVLPKKDYMLDHISALVLENPFGAVKIEKLDLSKNSFTDMRVFGSIMGRSPSLTHLDISQCHLGVKGIKTFAAGLKHNATLKWLNLFRNLVDVDGARYMAEALRVNKKLEYLDIGFNRIRDTGLRALTDAIADNYDSKLSKLGIRANFITDQGFGYLFERAVLISNPKLTHIFVKHNLVTEHGKIDLHRKLKTKIHVEPIADEDSFEIISTGTQLTFVDHWNVNPGGVVPSSDEKLIWREQAEIYVDEFASIEHLDEGVLARTIWALLPGDETGSNDVNRPAIKQKLDNWSFLVKDVRIRKGPKVTGRNHDNTFTLIEFAQEAAAVGFMNYQAKGYNILSYTFMPGYSNVKSFRAGTRTANPLKAKLAAIRLRNKQRRRK